MTVIEVAPRRPPDPAAWWPTGLPVATDVAALRRELIDYYQSDLGLELTAAMCAMGRQALMPPGRPEQQAAAVARDEIGRLRDADLFYVAPETVDLLRAAYEGYPGAPCAESDAPSRRGLIVFGSPILSRPVTDEELHDAYAYSLPPGTVERIVAARDPIYVIAAAWGPFHPPSWGRSGGRWVSFFSHRSQTIRHWPAPLADTHRSRMPRLTPENEVAYRYAPDPMPPGADPARYVLDDDRTGTVAWGRLLNYVWAMMRQDHLIDVRTERVDRPERRRHLRAGLPEPAGVTLIHLRRGIAEQAETAAAALAGGARPAGEWYSVRFPVRGHWRNQFYPSTGRHRLKYIPAHWKGPADAPVLIHDKITVF